MEICENETKIDVVFCWYQYTLKYMISLHSVIILTILHQIWSIYITTVVNTLSQYYLF